jgi:hypothetical protein
MSQAFPDVCLKGDPGAVRISMSGIHGISSLLPENVLKEKREKNYAWVEYSMFRTRMIIPITAATAITVMGLIWTALLSSLS